MRMIYQVTNLNKTPYMVGHSEAGHTEDSEDENENEDDISSN